MTNSDCHIRDILSRYIAGDYTPDELEQLLSYMQQENIEVFDEEAWHVWEELLQKNYQPKVEEAEKLGLKAMQIVGQQPVSIKIEPLKKISGIKVVRRLAATIAVLVALAVTLYLFLSDVKENPLIYRSVTAEKGQRKEMQLLDGSSVYLNSESYLAYPEKFSSNKREVVLSGEAFFEVTPDSTRPFIVRTSGVVIKVLGTSFNIRNYETDEILAITVSTGKVAVTTSDRLIYLLPDEQLLINRNTGEIKKLSVSADKYLQWRKGMLYFDHTPVAEVIETLERWYNIEIKMEQDHNIYISGEHDNKSLMAVLEAICFTTGLKYREDSNYFTLY